MLKAIAEYAKHDRDEFVRVVQEAQSSQQTAEVKKQRTRLATAKQRVSELEVLLCKIYEDNILGKLSDSRYATLDAQYAKEQAELTDEISEMCIRDRNWTASISALCLTVCGRTQRKSATSSNI